MRLGLLMRRMALDWTLSRRQRVDFGAPPQTWKQYSKEGRIPGCMYIWLFAESKFPFHFSCRLFIGAKPTDYVPGLQDYVKNFVCTKYMIAMSNNYQEQRKDDIKHAMKYKGISC